MKVLCCFGAAIFLFLFISLSYNPHFKKSWSRLSNKTADEITYKISDKMKADNELILMGTGGGIDDTIRQLDFSFSCSSTKDIYLARELLVNAIESILYEINGNLKYAFCFTEYPVSVKTLSVVIFFKEKYNSKVRINEISRISFFRGKLTYYVSQGPEKLSKMICEETYQEAVDILRLQVRKNI